MKHKGFTLVELLVVIGIIGLLIGMLLPNLTAAFREAQRTECSNNLRSIGQSLKTYAAGGRRNPYPSIYSRAGSERAATETWGAALEEATWELADRTEDEDVPLADTEPFTCNLNCLYLLVRDEKSDVDVFVCPGDSMAEVDDTPNPESFWSFKKLINCSYSYQNQLGKVMSEGSQSAKVVIMADKNPLRQDNMLEPGGAASENPYEWNSPNHRFEGQNCLFGDGHVSYEKSPFCGWNGNNIWIKETWEDDGDEKSWELVSGSESWDKDSARDYQMVIEDPRDSWLVP